MCDNGLGGREAETFSYCFLDPRAQTKDSEIDPQMDRGRKREGTFSPLRHITSLGILARVTILSTLRSSNDRRRNCRLERAHGR